MHAPPRRASQFRFDASLRIHGVGAQHDNIAIDTGLIPIYTHRAGDNRGRRGGSLGVWPEDMWRLQSPLGEAASLEEHVRWLWAAIGPHKAYFERLIAQATSADLCLGCLSESVYPFWAVPADALTITRELKLGLSFNFTVT